MWHLSFCNIFIDIHYIVIHMAKIKKITKEMDSVSDIPAIFVWVH